MRKRILHCLNEISRAGAQSFILNLYKELKDEYIFDFLVRTSPKNNDSELISLINSYGGKVYYTSPFPKKFIANFRETKDFFNKHYTEYYAIHVHANSLLYILPLKLAKKYNIKTRIIHSHNSKASSILFYPFHYINRTFSLKYANVRIACSDCAAKWMFNKKKYIMINNSIDVEKFSYNEATRRIIREELGLNDKFVIGNFGRFVKQKNHKMIVDIFELYHKKVPNSVLVLSGTGELLNETISYIERKKLGECVKYLGVRNDMNVLYQAIDVFLMPSLFEGLPFTLVEAQISKLPCVISSTISPDSVFTDYVYKMDLNNTLESWCTCIENTKKLQRKDLLVDAARFDIKETSKKMKKIYERELK